MSPDSQARVRNARWNVVLYSPGNNPDLMVFSDIALLLYHSIKSLGMPCRISINRLLKGHTNVLLGYHRISRPEWLSGHRVIIYQLEQLDEAAGIGVYDEHRRDVLRAATHVWDYDEKNISRLAEAGIHATKLPLGYHPHLDMIPDRDQHIDVLFYGSINSRRAKILQALSRHCVVKSQFRLYGEERNRLIARSRIVLNLHYYEMQIMEQARVSFLLNNRRFVLSESTPDNPYGDSLAVADYHQLVDVCMDYLKDDSKRATWAERSCQAFTEHPMTDFIQREVALLEQGEAAQQ